MPNTENFKFLDYPSCGKGNGLLGGSFMVSVYLSFFFKLSQHVHVGALLFTLREKGNFRIKKKQLLKILDEMESKGYISFVEDSM